MSKQRFDKIIASQLNISRKDARIGIKSGKGAIDGVNVKDPSVLADAELQLIEYDGQALKYKKYIYILMNKPKGVLSASNDKRRETVVDLVPNCLCRSGLFPVGRLDRDTTGLLIITDDGNFAHNVLSPKKNIYKTYKAQLDGEVTEDMVQLFLKGVVLADGTLCKPAYLKPLEKNCAQIKICEGRYHQIKRMFGTVGLGVNGLSRVALGGLKLPENFCEGSCRELTNAEKDAIFMES